MKLNAVQNISNVTTVSDLARYASIVFEQIESILNGGVTFTDNFQSAIVSVTFSAANTQVQIAHSLGRIPVGYILTKASAAMIIYDGGSANTANDIFLKSSAIGNAQILVF